MVRARNAEGGYDDHSAMTARELLEKVRANETFGTVLTESMGGYTYYKNSRLNRLTAWNNNGVTDIPSEVIYLVEEETKKKWSLGLNPMPDAQIYQVTYGFGYAKYAHESCGIEQEMLIFVPEKDPVKVQILTLKNKEPRKRELKVVYYLKPVLDEDEIKSHHFLDLSYDKKRNAIFFQNQIQMDAKQVGYVATSEPIQTYTGDRNCFFGKGNLADPEGLKKVFLDSSNSLFREGRIVLEMNVEIEAFEEKELIRGGAGNPTVYCNVRVGDLFTKLNLKPKIKISKRDDVSTVCAGEFDLPLVNAKHGSNGIMFYGRSSEWESAENTIDIIQNGAIATGDVYPQPHKCGVLWDAYLIKPISSNVNENILLYLSTCLHKSIKPKFSYDNKAVWQKVRKNEICLPLNDQGEVDYDYMNKYIGAVKKQVIKNLVLWKDKEIECMKKVVKA